MKKLIAITIILTALAGFVWAVTASVKNPYDLPIKKLHAAPSEDASIVLDIPIEVRLLDISADHNWYKVKIAYAFGPFNYSYIGWANIPVSDTLIPKPPASPESSTATNKTN